jgi:hypothetical protein
MVTSAKYRVPSLLDPNNTSKDRFFKSRQVFPECKHDELTVHIFTYCDVKNRALSLMSQINSKGYQLSKKESYYPMFVLYLRSAAASRHDYSFDDHETLKLYKNILIDRVDLYCDGNYPRGISITYLLDGWKS